MLPPKLWIKERYLWWRAFRPVIFAHKPLCEHFRQHIICIRGYYVCRSCMLLYGALAVSSLFSLWQRDVFYAGTSVWIAVAALTAVLSCPLWYSRFPRAVQDIVRTGLGLSMSVVLWLCFTGQWLLAGGMAACFYASRRIYIPLRARIRADACAACPEYHQPPPCSGFRLKKRKMQVYEKGLRAFVLGSKGGGSLDASP